MIPLVLSIVHVGFFAYVKGVIDGQIQSLSAATDAMASNASDMQQGKGAPPPLPPEMMPSLPEPFEIPAELSFSKLLVTFFLTAHVGLTQSSLNAIFADDTPRSIMMLAVGIFVLFPVGFIVYSTLTVRGAVGAGSLKWGRLCRSIPKDFEAGDLKFKPYLPRMDELKKKAVQAGGEVAGGDGKSQKQLYANIKKTLAAGNITDALRMQGYWEASTAPARRFLVIYGALFSKATEMGYVLMCVEMSKKLLQICLLTFLSDEQAKPQLIALQLLSAAQLVFVFWKQAYNERLRNIVEPVIMLAQFCVFLAPLLLLLEVYDDQTATAGMMGAATASVVIALVKELSSTVPGVIVSIWKLLSGPSDDDKSKSRRNVSAKLIKVNALGPDVLKHAASAVDEDTLALIKSSAEKAVIMLEQYATGASKSATKWLKDTGDEMIQQAREQGEISKVVPPVEIFHRDGLIDVAEGTLQTELLKLDNSKDANKLVKSLTLKKKGEEITESKRKFSELCEEYVLCLARPELESMVRENVAALDIPPSVPVEKQEIAEFAIDLCETFARKYVNELFIKAYNKAEAQVIELCGVGNASDDPGAVEVVRFSNPLTNLADDMEEEVAGKAKEKLRKEVAQAASRSKK